MEDTNAVKHSNTSMVIESLHGEIDRLKKELEQLSSNYDLQKRSSITANKRNELYVDQLANAKHENDMINALLKRKERRILDLEEKLDSTSTKNEDLLLASKNMKIRLLHLEETATRSTAEYERLKIAYDALQSSQIEYKKHNDDLALNLTAKIEEFRKSSLEKYDHLLKEFTRSEEDTKTLFESISNKKNSMDNVYVSKNKVMTEMLSKLAVAAKASGEQSKGILHEVTHNMNLVSQKNPDIKFSLEKINLDDSDQDSCSEMKENIFNEDSSAEDLDVSQRATSSKPNVLGDDFAMVKKRRNKRGSLKGDKSSQPIRSRVSSHESHLSDSDAKSSSKKLSQKKTPLDGNKNSRQVSNMASRGKKNRTSTVTKERESN